MAEKKKVKVVLGLSSRPVRVSYTRGRARTIP